ncbi:MAG: putative Ig domain-containing protein [Xanthomonadales bacterium]|nr:putative Ig domain-containing protein [Xanthomonadales bacterium]
MTVSQSTGRKNRWGWSSQLIRLGRALGVVTLALLLVQCGSADAPHEQAPVQARPNTGQAAAPAEAPTPDATTIPTILRGHILPSQPNATSTLTVDLRAVDPMGKPVTLEYQWLLDDFPIQGATAARLAAGEFTRGDTISVEVTPIADGRVGAEWKADPVEIQNSPPRVHRLGIEPSPATRREPLRAVADVSDPDGDTVTVSYQWLRNGIPISGATEATLDPSHYGRGDLLAVEIVATDGHDSTPALVSPEVDVLPAAPKFVSQVAKTDFKDGQFRYRAQAVHPDGNALEYTLSDDAPEGMRIDAESGLVEWIPEPSQTGTFAFQVIVEDPDGGRVAQPVTLTIEEQKQQ